MWRRSKGSSSGELPKLYDRYILASKNYDNDTLRKANVAASTFRAATKGVPSLRQLVLSRLGRRQGMTFLDERAKLRKRGVRNARLLFEPYNSVEESIFLQEIEVRISWEGEARGEERRNVPVFYHFDKEKCVLKDPWRPWGGIEVSYFAGCGSSSIQRFDLHADEFRFSLRTQEKLTQGTFHAAVDLMFGGTRAGKILRERIGGTERAFKVDTRAILWGGSETMEKRAVYTYSSERRRFPEDFPPSAEWGGKGFLDYFWRDFYSRWVSIIQEKYVKMVEFVNDPTLEDMEFLVNCFDYCMLSIWFDVEYEHLRDIGRLRALLR